MENSAFSEIVNITQNGGESSTPLAESPPGSDVADEETSASGVSAALNVQDVLKELEESIQGWDCDTYYCSN